MFSKFSVQKPYTVAVAIIAILILGVISFMNMTTDLLPSMELPYIILSTTYIGASPEEVEMVVTKPLESSMATVNDIKNVTSVSNENASMVILEFNDGANMDTAMIEISAKLDLIKPNWDDSVGAPIVMKINPDMLPVIVAAVDVEGLDPYELTDYVKENISPRIEAVGGVASVSESGLIEEEITATISKTKIDEVNLAILEEVDSELADVERQLRDGERALREAKAELAKQGQEGLKQLDQAIEGLEQAIAELEKQAEALEAERDALLLQREELVGGIAALEEGLLQMPAPMTQEQLSALAAMREAVAALDERMKKSDAELQKVEREIAKFPGHTQSGGSTGNESLDRLIATRDQLTATIEALKAQKKAIEESAEYRGLVALEAVELKRQEMEAQLQQLKATLEQLDNGIAEMEKAIENLKNGIVPTSAIAQMLPEGFDTSQFGDEVNLNELKEQLITQRAEVEKMLGEASSQIAEAQQKLGEARKEFEEKRDEALKNAKIDGIITVQMISQILGAENFQMPAGYITEDDLDVLVRVGEKFSDLESLQNMLIMSLGLDTIDDVRLKDVADVVITDNAATTYSKINGNNGVMITLQKQSTFSTADVADRVKAEFDQIMQEHPEVHISALMDQGIYINMIIDSVLENLIYGAILAILILLIFLGDFRPTVIVAFSIPISVITAFVAMYFTGITLNIISLAGLALAVGMLVDNSIVVIDNIYRLHEEGLTLVKACVYGAKQMAGAIFSSTLTTICVFLPIVFVEGLARQLFADMGLTIAFSLLASLLIALTLVPAMSSALLKRQRKRKHRIFGAIQRGYVKILSGALRAKILVIALAIALLVFSVAQVSSLGTAFMPDMDSTQMTATLTLPEDSTFDEQTQMGNEVMDILMTFEDVETVGVFTGGGTLMGGGSGGMTFYLLLKEDKSARNDQIAREMQAALEPLNYEVTFSTSNMDITMLYGEGIQVDVKGPDLNTLRKIASDVAAMMESVEGTINVSDGQEETVPELSIVVNKEKARAENLTVAQIYSFVATTIADGREVTTVTLQDKDYPVIVVDGENQKLTRADMEELYISVTKADEVNEIRLGDVCEIRETDSLTSIRRNGQQRTLSASCEIDPDHNIGAVGTALDAKLAEYDVPDGYTVETSGENDAINSTLNDLALMIGLAIVLIYLIMVAQFQSFLMPFIVIFTIPLAFTGGLLALYLAHMEVSMIAMLGFLVLAGVIVNNGIVFVDSINQLRIKGMPKRDAILETGKIRLRPILMTALTTILGMLTIALGTGMGAEMMQPMAVVTIGGLAYGTLMTLFVVPVLYSIFNRKKEMKAREVDLSEEETEILESNIT